MSDIRQVIVQWQGGESFIGQDKHDHKVTFGGLDGFSPMEMLLISLAGCTGMDVVSILEKKRQLPQELKITVSGSRREENPRIYKEIDINFEFIGERLEKNAVEQAIVLSSEKYCSISGMLNQAATIRTSYTIRSESVVTSK